jgi:hypothetical protein
MSIMRRGRATLLVVAMAGLSSALLTATSAAAARTSALGSAASLEQSSLGSLGTVSCASPGNCGAGGVYVDQPGFSYPSVADEQHGVWGHPAQVEGLPAPQYTNTEAGTESVSCASPGNCSAGGFYDTRTTQQAFVVTERHGVWGAAEPVAGLAQLNTGGQAAIVSVSCASARNCSAGGYYSAKTSRQTFVVTEQHGIWGTALSLASPASDEVSEIDTVSCARPGNCSAAGYYYNNTTYVQQAFVVSEKHSTWAAAEPVPGLAGLNKGGSAEIYALSCASPGNCSAGGYYDSSVAVSVAFVAAENHGTWGTAEPVTGPAWLSDGGYAEIESLSCASPGNCSATGSYGYWKDAQPFVVTEEHSSWGQALQVPGAPATIAVLDSVSCAAPGDCSAVGAYSPDYWGPNYALAASQKHGTWGQAQILTNP